MASDHEAIPGDALEQLIGDQLIDDHLIKHLSTIIAEHGKKSGYSRGGHIPIGDKVIECSPVVVCWDTAADSAVSKLSLPPTDDDLQRLINACQPDTFGHHHEEVMDLDYRLAGTMDPENFSTNLNLSSSGILDTVKQILRPRSARSKKPHGAGIRAELYKLHVSNAA